MPDAKACDESVDRSDLERKLGDASAVVTVSDFNLNFLSETYPGARSKIKRIYNGLDLTRFGYAAPRYRAPLVLGVGRLVEKKGFDVLLEACAKLAEKGREFRCEIIGHGDLESELRAQIDALRIGEVAQLVGPYPSPRVIERMQEAAVLAVPCVIGDDGNRDGLPTVLLEAMALGTPCVSTDVTGIPEVIRDAETGLLVPQHDANALADAIDRLIGDAAIRVKLAENARRLIDSEFDIEVNARQLRESFTEGKATRQRPEEVTP